MMKIEEVCKIQGLVQTIRLQQFNKISKILVHIKLKSCNDCILVRKWITEQEKIFFNTMKINSKLEVVGRIEYDNYLKENVMNAQKLNRL